ncbi:DoxX family protein [Sphingomonas sp.]|uniref:DoxX family protein n=1 Tax=Sphingomonas sp. TaxID=28214 RepID=UPI0025E5FEF5|nr:DoxX family protein [Sphingomonas sp.]
MQHLDHPLSRALLSAAYGAAGILHVTRADIFLRIMPPWVPFPRETVIATGLCEMAGAIGLMIPRTRRLAGVMLALYALCVWPANVQHAINDLGTDTGLGWWYHVPRLLAQPLIIWWALHAGGVTDWPFRPRRPQR